MQSLILSSNVSTTFPPQQDCDPFLDTTLVKIIKTIAYTLLLVLSLAGNTMVIVVVYRNINLRTIINFFILNISVSDLLIPLLAHTTRIKDIYLPQGLWPIDGLFGVISCKLTPFGHDTSIAVSILTMEIIAVERFFHVVFPMKRRLIRNKKTCFTVIALVWFTGALSQGSYFYSAKLIHRNATPYCIYSWEPAFDHTEAFKADASIFLVAFTIIPLILLTSLYSAVIVSLHRQKARLRMASNARKRRAKKYRQISYMLAVVVFVFLVTWTPVNIYGFLSSLTWSSHRPCEGRHLMFIAGFFMYSCSAVNPIIYYIFNSDYRKGFQELFHRFRRCKACCSCTTTRPAIEGRINDALDLGHALNLAASKAVVILSVKPLDNK